MNRLFATRHAAWDTDPLTNDIFLTEDGIRTCESKVTALLDQEIGRGAILLSSAAERARLTANEMQHQFMAKQPELGIDTVYRSPFISAAGLRPTPIKDFQALNTLTESILRTLHLDHEDRDVVLVTHQPFIDTIDKAAGDMVVEISQDWVNPDHRPTIAHLANGDTAHLEAWIR